KPRSLSGSRLWSPRCSRTERSRNRLRSRRRVERFDVSGWLLEDPRRVQRRALTLSLSRTRDGGGHLVPESCRQAAIGIRLQTLLVRSEHSTCFPIAIKLDQRLFDL